MKQTFCEYMMWHGFPIIRKKIAEVMMEDYGLTQKEVAEKLGITPAAVCQYISKKRARIDMVDGHLLKEIRLSAEKIINDGGEQIIPETCRICKIIRSNGVSSSLSIDDKKAAKVYCCEPLDDTSF